MTVRNKTQLLLRWPRRLPVNNRYWINNVQLFFQLTWVGKRKRRRRRRGKTGQIKEGIVRVTRQIILSFHATDILYRSVCHCCPQVLVSGLFLLSSVSALHLSLTHRTDVWIFLFFFCVCVFLLGISYLALCIMLTVTFSGLFPVLNHSKIKRNLMPVRWVSSRTWAFFLQRRNHMAVHTDGNSCLNFQERVQQLEEQLREMEKEKERELSALRKEKRELVHTTQMVGENGFIYGVSRVSSAFWEDHETNTACLLHKNVCIILLIRLKMQCKWHGLWDSDLYKQSCLV